MTVAPPPSRRSRPSPLAGLRRYWLVALFFFGCAAALAVAFAHAPAFRLHALRVTGLARVSRDEVVARAAIDPQANVWLLDRAAIGRRIEAIPYVATARVHARPLGDLWIEIAERIPDGCVRSRGGRAATVDRFDRILQIGCSATLGLTYELRAASDTAPGRYERSAELELLQADARALASTGERFRNLRHDPFGGLEADLQDGVRIRFGDDRDLERKRRLIAPILAQTAAKGEVVRAVDLRAPATPVVEYRPTPQPSDRSVHTIYTRNSP
ncbi:MAG: hypothetical protein NVS2B3_02900 [Vulcanimicrobiaceae bacterium]